MIKAKVSTDYKDIERIFAGGSIQKEILKVWSTEADAYVFEAWKILEMEGPLPITITTNGEPLIDYRIYGNTVQNGTPTPENPIMPIGCGERTGNLFDKDATLDGYWLSSATGNVVSHAGSSVSDYIRTSDGESYTLVEAGKTFCWYDENKRFISTTTSTTASAPTGAAYFRVNLHTANKRIAMVIEGSTALPYEPYGYKLPILSNSTVTNIYLGEVQTTRRIKKLVLTGTETWNIFINGPLWQFYTNNIIRGLNSSSCMSNIAEYGATANTRQFYDYGAYLVSSGSGIAFQMRGSKDTLVDVSAWKSYLQQQYAAGTPVTVWYVLDEPETAVVNEPLMKIGEYVDTIDSTQANVQIPTSKGTTILDYDGEDHFITSDGYELVDKNQNGFLLSGSTLRPSKMYIKYKGR